jgi:hypothetical protein
LIHEEGNATLYGFDAFKSGHYGNRFPLHQSSLGHHDVACEPRIINILQRQRIAPPQVVYAGIYSGKYEGQYNALYTQLTAQGVQETNIMFKRVTQETFRLRQNCFWCGKSCHFAFHHGETCKIDFQLELYKRFVNRNVIIIFLDVDVELHSNIPDWSAVLGEYEIAFEREDDKASARWVSNINIGFTLCRPAENVIQFYETVLHTLRQRKPPLNWDQQVVNEMFKNQAPLRMKLLKGGEETGFKHARAGGGSKSNLKMSTSKAKELATVAVVGSTNIVLCGSEIESADTVIRVGNEPQNDARNIGSRTDLCVQSLGDAMSHLKEPNIKISLFGFDKRMVSRFLSDLRVTIGKSVMRIPIAEDCYSTRMLGKMRVSATPFDWIVLSPRTVMELIRSDFHDFLEDVVLHKQNTRVHFVKNAWDGTDTVMNTVEFWDRRQSILVPHHMTSISELPALRAKMRERINRMYADMKAADEIEFWYKPTSEKELSGLPNKSGFGEDEMRKVEYELVRLVCERFHKRDSDVRVCYL